MMMMMMMNNDEDDDGIMNSFSECDRGIDTKDCDARY